jgi:hypothetical protein
LKKIAQLDDTVKRRYIYLILDESMDEIEQANTLQARLDARGPRAPFDPKTLDESIGMIRACQIIRDILRADGQEIVTISTRQPLTDKELRDALLLD